MKNSAHIRDMNRHIPVLTAFMLAIALLAIMFGNFFGSPLVSFADSGEKVIYLTFDDGPSDRVTPKILDVLKEENVPATFFIVGKNALSRKNILKRAFEEGHTLAVHSYSHDYKKIYASSGALLDDIEKCNQIICSVTGEYSHIYRFPGGSFSIAPELVNAVESMGYIHYDWNASLRDSEIKDPTPGKLYSAAISTVSNKQKIIMLAHDSTDKIETAQAIKEVIRHFKKAGYVFKKL